MGRGSSQVLPRLWRVGFGPPPVFCRARRLSLGDAGIMTRPAPDFAFETVAVVAGANRVAGVDEVGRGPLAGPVTAAAVVLRADDIPPGLDDSKALTAKRRAALFEQIIARAEVSVAHASVAEIDEMNILRAAHLAMERAVAGLDPAFTADQVLGKVYRVVTASDADATEIIEEMEGVWTRCRDMTRALVSLSGYCRSRMRRWIGLPSGNGEP